MDPEKIYFTTYEEACWSNQLMLSYMTDVVRNPVVVPVADKGKYNTDLHDDNHCKPN